VEVVVCVENIVVRVSHTQQPNHSALQTSACYPCALHALNHRHKDQTTLGYVEREQDGVLILEGGLEQCIPRSAAEQGAGYVGGLQGRLLLFRSHAQSTNDQRSAQKQKLVCGCDRNGCGDMSPVGRKVCANTGRCSRDHLRELSGTYLPSTGHDNETDCRLCAGG
jgi:hypothetical protein